MPKKRQHSESPPTDLVSSEPASDESRQYTVEVISAARVDEERCGWEYYVKWANYSSVDNSWEPEHHLNNCERLLRSFWRHVAVDKKDYASYPQDDVVNADKSWIAAEKARFKRSGESKESEKQDSSEPDDEQRRKRIKRTSSTTGERKGKTQVRVEAEEKPTTERVESTNESDHSDDVPLFKRARKRPLVPSMPDKSEKSVSEGAEVGQPPRQSQSGNSTTKKGKGKEKPQLSVQTDGLGGDSAHSLFSASSSPDISLSQQDQVPVPNSCEINVEEKSTAPKDAPRQPQERRGIKQLNVEYKGSATSGISTKSRLARSHPDTSFVAPPHKQKSVFAGKSFKKKSADNNTTPTAETSTSRQSPFASSTALKIDSQKAAALSSLASPVVQSPLSAQGGFVNSPVAESAPTERSMSYIEVAPARPSVPLTKRPQIPLPRRASGIPLAPHPPIASRDLAAEVDHFLSTIMPPELAAPMQETSGSETPLSVRPTSNVLAATKQPTVGRIPKKWKWSGELFVHVNADKADRLCNIALHDATDPRPDGLRFSICLTSSVNSIRLQKMYNVADLYFLLRACAPVQQFAKLTHQDQEDLDSLAILADYMKKTFLFTYAHLYLDNAAVALLLIIPSACADICTLLKVPSETRSSTTLVAALVPWVLSNREYAAAPWCKARSIIDHPDAVNEQDATWLKTLSIPVLHRSLRILNFPESLYKFMSQPNRRYCIWSTPVDDHKTMPGLETFSLRVILDECKALDVGWKADLRVIFVHVGALATLWKLPALAERRWKRPEVRFFSYGSHEDIPPERWGVREIYPLGGIVAFTPCAVVEDLLGVLQFIKKIDQHPLWECYMLPSVVAMVAKLTCQGQHPLALFDKGELIFEELLHHIADGKISVLQAPPLTRLPQRNNDPAIRWVSWQLRLLATTARGVLEECITLAAEQYRVSEADLPSRIRMDIQRDLQRMQLQPAIMDDYRRFVIIEGKGDRRLPQDEDGIERVELSNFEFRDDFFAQEPSKAPGKV